MSVKFDEFLQEQLLDDEFKKEYEALYGQIYSDINITNAGVFEVRPVAFYIVDSVSKKPIFQATGEMQGQILIADSAAQKIAAVTGPHKDWKETIGGMPLPMFLQQK